MKKIRVVSLFSGIGGFEEGLKLADIDYEIVFASEIDKYARLSYTANFSEENLYGDITLISEKKVPDHDLLIAGFPCQSFSIAGKRKGFDDTRGTLFFDIVRILREKKPKYILLENVKNLTSHDRGKTIDVILSTLSNLGYAIDFSVINTSESGVPQNRERTYIVGIYHGQLEKYEQDQRNSIVDELKKSLNTKEIKSFNFFSNLTFNADKQYLKDVIEKNVEKKYFFSSEAIDNFLDDLDIKETNECKTQIIKLFDFPRSVLNDLERQRRVYSIHGISPTVLARTDAAKIFLTNGERRYVRKLTAREVFYVQGFSNSFVHNIEMKGISATQMYKQAGNAVCPQVVAGIAKKLLHEELNAPLKFIDLFCGIGGFRIAFENLGCKCVFSSDIDKYACETYEMNFGENPLIDITTVNEVDIPDHDILCAGFPCQPFSIGGKRMGFDDTRGTLFFDVLRILNKKRPKAFLLENVAGLVSHDGGKTLKVITESLKEIGYNIVYKVINAKDVGYPQNRNRWYCVGFRKDVFDQDISMDYLFPKNRELYYSLNDVIRKTNDSSYDITDTAKKNINSFLYIFKQTSRYDESYPLIATEIRKSRCNFRCDGISPCLTAKMGTGGNNIPVLVKDNMRKLTEEECLSIMGFPQSFRIKKNSYQSYKQIGNSVVVPVIQEIGEMILKTLFI